MIIVTPSVDGDIARFELSGRWTASTIGTLVDEVERFCSEHGLSRVLVDARPIARPPSDVRRHEAGKYIAERVGSRVKVAVLYREGHISKMLELSAVNRGAMVLVTHSMEEARDWLRDDPRKREASVLPAPA